MERMVICNYVGVTYGKVYKLKRDVLFMRFETNLPKKYNPEIWSMPPFKEGKITKRVRHGLENTLCLYSTLARSIAKATDNNPKNYQVKQVFVVGSGDRENKIDSDLDFLLLVPSISEQTAKDLKVAMSYVLFCDRPKQEAIDVYIRDKDAYPSRNSADITEQSRGIIDKYNSTLEKDPE